MKKIFTLMAAALMAASVNAQKVKTITADTYFATTTDNVAAGITEGWIAEGSGATAANSKKGSINPETKEDLGAEAFKTNGIDLKDGGATKYLKMFVTGISSIEAYGVTTSSSDTRNVVVTATPDEGAAIEGIESSSVGVTAVVKLTLDKTKTYTIDVTGKNEDLSKGADIALHGIWFYAGTPTGISEVTAAKPASAEATYNLLGQKVSGSAKGLVIKNGKKFLSK